MEYLSVKEISKIWNISERSVRNYCLLGRINGAVQKGKVWYIPKNTQKPKRKNSENKVFRLVDILKREKNSVKDSIMHINLYIFLFFIIILSPFLLFSFKYARNFFAHSFHCFRNIFAISN